MPGLEDLQNKIQSYYSKVEQTRNSESTDNEAKKKDKPDLETKIQTSAEYVLRQHILMHCETVIVFRCSC